MLIKKRTIIPILLCILIFSLSAPILMSIKTVPKDIFGGEKIVVLTNTQNCLNTTLAAKLEDQAYVELISPEIYAFCIIRDQPVFVRGVKLENFLKIENARIVRGNANPNKDFAFLGARLAKRLSLTIGDDFTITGSWSPAILETTVTGIFASRSVADDELLLPLEQVRPLVGLSGSSVSAIRVKTSNQSGLLAHLQEEPVGIATSDVKGGTITTHANQTYQEAVRELAFKYSNTLRLDATNGTYVSMVVQKASGSVSFVSFSFIGLTAALAFIGISACLARAVRDRWKELGIISAIGANKMKIRIILLKNLLIISLPAVALGMGLGLVGTKLLGVLGIFVVFEHTIKPLLSFPLMIGTFFSSLIISSASGLFVTENLLKYTPVQSISGLAQPGIETEPPHSNSNSRSLKMQLKHLMLILVLLFVAFITRLIPLTFSSLPLNIDGFPLIRISEDMLEGAHWSIPSKDVSELVRYNSKLPVISLILTSFSLILGKQPLELAQVLVPLIGITSIITVYMLALKITKHSGVALSASLVLALSGFYVYLTTALMKEAIGLALLPLIIYLYQERHDYRKRFLALFLLFLIPLAHHLSLLIILTILGLLTISSTMLALKSGRLVKNFLLLDILFLSVVTLFSASYYNLVKLKFFQQVTNLHDIALFVAVFIIMAIISIRLAFGKRVSLANLLGIIGVPGVGIALLLINSQTKIFAGTTRSSLLFLKMLIPYLILIFIGVIGAWLVLTRKNPYRPLIFCLALGPLTVIAFALLRGLDPFSFVLGYRSIDFMDAALAVCVGIGLVYVTKIFKGTKLKSMIFIVFVLVCLLSLPLAYSSEKLFRVKDVTEEYEFSAVNWVKDNAFGEVGSDQRLSDILGAYYRFGCDKLLPLKIKYGESIKSDFILIQKDWTSKGAQIFPDDPIIISQRDFDNIIDKNDLVYVSGPKDKQMYILKIRHI